MKSMQRSCSSHNESIQKEFSAQFQANAYFDINKQTAMHNDLIQPLIDYTKIIHSKLSDPSQCKVLDVACGAGLLSVPCAKQLNPCKKVIGIDITNDMLNNAKKYANDNELIFGPNDDAILDFVHGNVEQLPFEDEEFNIVITRWTFHHFEKLNTILKEIHRVLNKENGHLIFMDMKAPNITEKSEKIYNAIEILRDPTHIWAYDKIGWIQQLIDAGFDKNNIAICKEYEGGSRKFMDWIKQTNAPHRENLYVLVEELYKNGVETGFNLEMNENEELMMRHPYIIMQAAK